MTIHSKIPSIGLGTYMMSPEEAEEMTYEAIKIGYRHIDTAEVYRNEQGVAKGIERSLSEGLVSRSELFITTKVFPGNEIWGQSQKTFDDVMLMAEKMLPMMTDVTEALHGYREAGKSILFEGAQGSLLDIDHGTYPFVTSSNTTAGGAATGTGVGPLHLDYILGITKAYTTRVGSGPFPTELSDDVGAHLAEKGNEFGATTGRARRCGWFDAVAVRRAVQLNSLSGICLTKLDVLDGLETIKVCTGYHDAEGNTLSLNTDSAHFAQLVPVYKEVPGWQETTFGAKTVADLPAAARDYIALIEQVVGTSIDIVSTGPDRSETIILNDLLAAAI